MVYTAPFVAEHDLFYSVVPVQGAGAGNALFVYFIFVFSSSAQGRPAIGQGYAHLAGACFIDNCGDLFNIHAAEWPGQQFSRSNSEIFDLGAVDPLFLLPAFLPHRFAFTG